MPNSTDFGSVSATATSIVNLTPLISMPTFAGHCVATCPTCDLVFPGLISLVSLGSPLLNDPCYCN